MNLFAKVLHTLSSGKLMDVDLLRNIYNDIVDEHIPAEHLISYLNVYDVGSDTWLSKDGNEILFFSEQFESAEVNRDWEEQTTFRQEHNLRSFRHYVFGRRNRNYPLLLITRSNEKPTLYPHLEDIILQVPATDEGARLLAEKLKFEREGDIERFAKIFRYRNGHFSNWKYIYYYVIRTHGYSVPAGAGVSIFTSAVIPQVKLEQLIIYLDMLFAHVDLDIVESPLKKFSLRSAIAAIMSRNMSHNLGSHVLARVATRGMAGWAQNKSLKDIVSSIRGETRESKHGAVRLAAWGKNAQFLALYLQQRMDFIAQISSEWPAWTEPAFLLKNVMRWFLYQQHLLNFIAASENLGARLYHETRHRLNMREYDGDIRLHMFIMPEALWMQRTDVSHKRKQKTFSSVECRLEDLRRFLGTESADAENHWQNVLLFTPKVGDAYGEVRDDILLALPGGIVGYQAFYVLMENIIRNAAKHSFNKKGTDHLDIVIEVYQDSAEEIAINNEDENRTPAWLIRIYDNVSFVRNGRRKNGVVLWKRDESEKGINDNLGRSVIDVGLKKEGWGLSEMKIAAGYLQRRTILNIGRQGEEITGPAPAGSKKEQMDLEMLNLARSRPGGTQALIRAVESPIQTLGYEFCIPRNKTVGILFPEASVEK